MGQAPSGVQVEGAEESDGRSGSDLTTDAAGADSADTAPGSADGESPIADSDSADAPAHIEAATDYANDAGKDLKEYDYPEDPEPAESIVATLCNLNRDYIASLRSTEDGVPVVDDGLRTTLVAFSDYLGHWDTLRPHNPESVADIDAAQQIFDLWNQAMLDRDNGDADAAQRAMLEAEELLNQLPTEETNACTTE